MIDLKKKWFFLKKNRNLLLKFINFISKINSFHNFFIMNSDYVGALLNQTHCEATVPNVQVLSEVLFYEPFIRKSDQNRKAKAFYFIKVLDYLFILLCVFGKPESWV